MIPGSACAFAVWSVSFLVAFWIAKDAKFLKADNNICADVHADLNFCWMYKAEGIVSDLWAQITLEQLYYKS